MLLLQIFFATLLFSFWYSSYTLLCIKIVSQLLNVLLCYYFSILFLSLYLNFVCCFIQLLKFTNNFLRNLFICCQKYFFFISVAVFFPIPGDLPNRGIELASLESPALAGRVFTTAPHLPTQGSNPGLLHCMYILYCLNHQSPVSRDFQAF